MTCSVQDCERKYYARGFCRFHYNRTTDRRAKGRASSTKWAKANRSHLRAYSAEYDYTDRGRFRYLKAVAKRRGHKMELTLEFYSSLRKENTWLCSYCDGEIGKCGHGLDRVNSDFGYVFGNVVPCCGDCNFRKGYLSLVGFPQDRVLELMSELRSTPNKPTLKMGHYSPRAKRIKWA